MTRKERGETIELGKGQWKSIASAAAGDIVAVPVQTFANAAAAWRWLLSIVPRSDATLQRAEVLERLFCSPSDVAEVAASIRTIATRMTDPTPADIPMMVAELREESRSLQSAAWSRSDGGQDCSISAALADKAADALETLLDALSPKEDAVGGGKPIGEDEPGWRWDDEEKTYVRIDGDVVGGGERYRFGHCKDCPGLHSLMCCKAPTSGDPATPAVEGIPAGMVAGKLGYRDMGSGGRCDWTHLREAVAEATVGSRAHATAFDPSYYQGHQMVGGHKLQFARPDRDGLR